MNWCNQHNGVTGILMPDTDSGREMYNIETKERFYASCQDISQTNEALITIGRFNFFASAFERANQVLSSALKQKPGWLIIDEAGMLELKGEGFYSQVAEAIRLYSSINRSGNLLITVRDSLCDEMIRHFSITRYTIIDSLELLPE